MTQHHTKKVAARKSKQSSTAVLGLIHAGFATLDWDGGVVCGCDSWSSSPLSSFSYVDALVATAVIVPVRIFGLVDSEA